MHPNPKNSNVLDDFSRQVGEKVKNHRLPVDSDVWTRLETQLASARKPAPVWPWAAAVAAALVGLLLLLNPFVSEKKDAVVVQETTVGKSESAVTAQQHSNSAQETAISPVKPQQKLFAAHKETVKSSVSAIKSDVVADDGGKHEQPDLQSAEDKRPEPQKQPAEEQPVVKKEEQSPPTETIEQPQKKAATSVVKQVSGKKPLLIARLGGGAGAGGFQLSGGDNYYNSLPSLGDHNGKFESNDGTSSSVKPPALSFLKPSDFSEIRHSLPISFSLMAEFPVNNTWSLQAGLMYTFLSSTFKKDGLITYRGVQRLHYVGIPLSVKANLWQNNRSRIYVLGGGAVEKGVRLVYNQTATYGTGGISERNIRSSINGVQFSTNAALGADYKITDNIRMFGEPNIVYYFNNKQPVSVRTENPLTFNLNAGIRINFGKSDDKK